MLYKIFNQAFGFGVGTVLRLTPQQAADRMHNLEPVEPAEGAKFAGEFRVTRPVEFKAGETIELLAGEVGKADVDHLLPLDSESEMELRRLSPDAPRRRARG